MDATIKNQIMEIRKTGEANMLDIGAVQKLAYDREYYELVTYIEDHQAEYVNFILTGKER